MRKGTEERKFDKLILPRLEVNIEKAHYKWKEVKDIFKKNVFNFEEKHEVETNFASKGYAR